MKSYVNYVGNKMSPGAKPQIVGYFTPDGQLHTDMSQLKLTPGTDRFTLRFAVADPAWVPVDGSQTTKTRTIVLHNTPAGDQAGQNMTCLNSQATRTRQLKRLLLHKWLNRLPTTSGSRFIMRRLVIQLIQQIRLTRRIQPIHLNRISQMAQINQKMTRLTSLAMLVKITLSLVKVLLVARTTIVLNSKAMSRLLSNKPLLTMVKRQSGCRKLATKASLLSYCILNCSTWLRLP